MARERPPEDADIAEFRTRFQDLITGLSVDELGDVARQLMTLAGPAQLPSARPAERRRPRRADEVTYRVRADLHGVKPPIWRRLELGSHLFLNELHAILQTAFGWTDSHLHRFASGPSVWDRSSQPYLCPFDVEEGDEEDGIPEAEVRLDEVLVDVGDRLHYAYDFGDGWEHVVRLEAVLDRPPDAVPARCTAGRRAGPPEDCGGVWGYAELVAAGEVDPDDFDVEEVNASLSSERELADIAATVPGAPGALLRGIQGYPVEREFADLLRDAQVGAAVAIDSTVASAMVERYVWLLERVGDDGLRLTSAGHLPPRDVEAAMTELRLGDEWIGKGNREVQTYPVLALRESAQRMGLLRKHRGDLLLTSQARKVRRDPGALWWHIASRVTPRDPSTIEAQAGAVTLAGVAAGRDIRSDPFQLLLREVLVALGWRTAHGQDLPQWSGIGAARDTVLVLEHMGAFTSSDVFSPAAVPTPGGRAFARAVFRTDPSAADTC